MSNDQAPSSRRPRGPDPELPRIKAVALSIAMLGAVAAPGARWLATGEADDSVLKELRPQVPLPEAPRWGQLTEASSELSDWFDDRFPFRRDLVRAHNTVDWFVLGTTPSNAMQRGRDGWLFLDGAAMDAYRGTDPFSAEEVGRWTREHAEYADWLAARDCLHLYLPAPDKQGVYPEFLPEWLTAESRPNRTDQILGALSALPRTIAVDARPLSEDLKSLGHIYYPLGTHWSTAGAYAGYQALVAPLAERFPAVRPLTLEDLDVVGPADQPEQWKGDTWLERCQIDDLVLQEAVDLVAKRQTYRIVDSWMSRIQLMDGITRNERRDLPRALLLSDSYGDAIWYFLADCFSAFQKESVLRFAPELVEELRPEVVIQLRVERYLQNPLERHGIAPASIAAARAWLAAEPAGEPVEGRAPVGAAGLPTGYRNQGPGTWLRVEREPGVAAELQIVAGQQELSVSLETWQRWAFVDVSGFPQDEPILIRAANPAAEASELRGWALRR